MVSDFGYTTGCGVISGSDDEIVGQLAHFVGQSLRMRIKKEDWERAKALYFAGQSWDAIANDLQISKKTLAQRASIEGLTKVKKEMRSLVSTKEIQSIESLSAIVRSKLAADAASTLERIDSYDLDGIKDESLREGILQSVSKRSALVFGWSEGNESTSVSINLLGSMPDRFAEIQVTK